MPGGDRTGPAGMGPQTGRAAGFCSGNDVPGSMNPTVGRGGGFGGGRAGGRGMANRRGRNQEFGWGRGWRWRSFVPVGAPAEDQLAPQALEERMEQLRAELSDIQQRMNELKSTGTGGEGE